MSCFMMSKGPLLLRSRSSVVNILSIASCLTYFVILDVHRRNSTRNIRRLRRREPSTIWYTKLEMKTFLFVI